MRKANANLWQVWFVPKEGVWAGSGTWIWIGDGGWDMSEWVEEVKPREIYVTVDVKSNKIISITEDSYNITFSSYFPDNSKIIKFREVTDEDKAVG